MYVARPVGRDDDKWRPLCPENTELGHGHRIVRQGFEQEGFELIDSTLSLLVDSLADALTSLGEDDLLPFLPWRGETPKSDPPEGIQQLYSIG